METQNDICMIYTHIKASIHTLSISNDREYCELELTKIFLQVTKCDAIVF